MYTILMRQLGLDDGEGMLTLPNETANFGMYVAGHHAVLTACIEKGIRIQLRKDRSLADRVIFWAHWGRMCETMRAELIAEGVPAQASEFSPLRWWRAVDSDAAFVQGTSEHDIGAVMV